MAGTIDDLASMLTTASSMSVFNGRLECAHCFAAQDQFSPTSPTGRPQGTSKLGMLRRPVGKQFTSPQPKKRRPVRYPARLLVVDKQHHVWSCQV